MCRCFGFGRVQSILVNGISTLLLPNTTDTVLYSQVYSPCDWLNQSESVSEIFSFVVIIKAWYFIDSLSTNKLTS